MKLAEALSIRKDLQKRIEQLGQRIQYNVKVQEGDEPSEQPDELMKELDSCLVQLEELVWRINTTNMQTKNAEGRTVTQLMAQKEAKAAKARARAAEKAAKKAAKKARKEQAAE